MKSLYIYIFCLIILGTNAHAQESELGPEQCGPISSPGQYGPFDYNNAADREERLPVVEQYHFSKNIQALKPDVNGSLPGPHLDYVLRAFPNHHPALNLL